MADTRPNILLIVTDQQRGDCLGSDGHPVLQTPWLDQLAAQGARFRRAYSAHPQCIPARRTLITGRQAVNHGVYNNYNTILPFPTLPGELSAAGYQSHICGKMHLWPFRSLHGHMSGDFADSMTGDRDSSDYTRWLTRQGVDIPRPGEAHGCHPNGRSVRTWHLDERHHLTNWCTDRALDFIERRDPTNPFFLSVGYLQPHQPLVPPEFYFRRYMDQALPPPVFGDWCAPSRGMQPGLPVDAWYTELPPRQMHELRAAYYACINHIDDQIGRLLMTIPRNTVVLFTSDHGEMLGDHRLSRKTRAFEPSARIPFLMRWPDHIDSPARGQVRSEPVELMDVMPTLLACAGVPIPAGVDGRSVLPLLHGTGESWREHLHGEMSVCGGASDYGGCATGMQFLTDGRWKFIWEPGPGHTYLFDLDADPQELQNLAGCTEHTVVEEKFRNALIHHLDGREEGFVRDGALHVLGNETSTFQTGWACPGLAAVRHV